MRAAAAAGGVAEIAARADQPVQVVDSRDLARLTVQLAGDDVAGTYNAVGPAEAATLQQLFVACVSAAGSDAHSVWAAPVDGLPLVIADAADDAVFRRRADLARAAGLPATPLVQTAADVLAWDRARGLPPLQVP